MYIVLDTYFNKPDRRNKALADYIALKQGLTESFADFYNRYKACALILNKNKESATHELITKLNTRFYTRLITDISTKYVSII